MTFKNIKLKNLCYLFLIFKEVHTMNETNDKTKQIKTTANGLKSEQVNFVCTHTKILFIITFTKELLFFI
jgi:hypothetical protein